MVSSSGLITIEVMTLLLIVVVVVHHKVSGLITRERFHIESPTFTRTDIQTGLPDSRPCMKSLASSDRLQNVSEYCIKVHKTGPAGIESNSSPLMTYRKYAAIFRLTGAAFRLAPPIGGLLVK